MLQNKIQRAVIYCGSSISINEAKKMCPYAIFPGPIKRGDLCDINADIYCIIDGFFYQNLAVSPKEIVQILRKNKKVIGSSSMGALRAAECSSLGMIGIGEIYKAYRNGLVQSDDEVAIMMEPYNFTQLSDALIDIRFFLKKEIEKNNLNKEIADKIFFHFERLHFAKRNFEIVIEYYVSDNYLTKQQAEYLTNAFRASNTQKYSDALECLSYLNRQLNRN